MARTRLLSVRVLELAVVALVGGALALGGAALFGKLGSRTTIQQVAPLGGGGVGNVMLQAPTTGALTAEQIYKRDAPGVVQVTATNASSGSESLGSGFVIDKAGHIITNFHVVRGATKVLVSFSSNDQLVSTVVGLDPSTDIAVLKIETHASALTPLELGNSDAVRVGDTVYAIGNPFGYVRTLTSGIVSAVQRQIKAPNSLTIDNVIQTDASINHGNSGGPLLDAAGRVTGVTSQIYAENSQQGNLGIGFAVPVNTVRNIAAQIISTGKVAHAYLGVSTVAVTKQLSKLYNLPSAGLLVGSVDSNGPAKKAGLVGGTTDVVVGGESYRLGGDVIVTVDGTPVSAFEQLRDAIARKKPGDKIKLGTVRNGSVKSVTVTLGQAPGG
ncbi:MAG TPA: trypsin-like peptidase domain-containing protein [Gaiellaceae bacterium]|nr:trypsin-like peptidase domain-containing protein [Gaiellaceae bacterium]